MTPAPGSTATSVPNVVLTFNGDLTTASVDTTTVKLSSAQGGDGQWGTLDDTYVNGTVAYSAASDTVTFTPAAALPDGQYAIWLDGTSSITGLEGNKLDGEYTGAFPSGDGVPGGDFVGVFTLDGTPDATAGLAAKTDSAGAAIPAATWQMDNDPYFHWTAPNSTSPIAGYSYALDGAPDQTVDTANTWYQAPNDGLADGQHTFRVKARDGAGNWGPASAFDIWVDTAPPRISRVVLNPNMIRVVFNEDIVGATLTTATFRLSSAPGPDGQWCTPDDTYLAGTVFFDTVTHAGAFAPATALVDGTYGLWLDGATITDLAGYLLDGEFNGNFPTGDGTAGGDFDGTFRMVTLSAGKGTSRLEYTDQDGDLFRLDYKGPGVGAIIFNLSPEAGANVDINSITFTGAAPQTQLISTLRQVTPAGQGRTTLQTLAAPVLPLGTLDFSRSAVSKTPNLTTILGDVTVGGAISKLIVGGSLGDPARGTGTVTLGGGVLSRLQVGGDVASAVNVTGKLNSVKVGGGITGPVNVTGPVNTVKLTGALNGAFTATGLIKSFTAGSLGPNAQLTSTGDSINSLRTYGAMNGQVQAQKDLRNVRSDGDLGADLEAGIDIRSVFAKGNLTGDLRAAGTIKTVTAKGNLSGDLHATGNIGTVRAEGILNSEIRAAQNLATVAAGAGGITSTRISAGVGPNANGQFEAADSPVLSRTIGSISTKGGLKDVCIAAGLNPGANSDFGRYDGPPVDAAEGRSLDNQKPADYALYPKPWVRLVSAAQYQGDVRILTGGNALGTCKIGRLRITASVLDGADSLTMVRTANDTSTVV